MKIEVTLEQWQALIAVVECHGYASAAEHLDKSQSSISYAIQKLETALSVRVFELQGRRAALTPMGKQLYGRAKVLVEDALQVEGLAKQFSKGWEPSVSVAADALVPSELMLDVIEQFAQNHPLTRIEWREAILSGTDEALLQKQADIVITARLPPGYVADPLVTVDFQLVAAPSHPLHQLGRDLSYQDLRLHRQLVVRDSGKQDVDAGWLQARQRVTVSNFQASVDAVCRGIGFAWIPTTRMRTQLKQGVLKRLPLATGGQRNVTLYLVVVDADRAGPGVVQLAKLLQAYGQRLGAE
ncbi:LysR family transcriptional regulator [Neptunomonas marina]|uniref:LysR family transcriptional regulator n=1 Tax=Neptunomonas marina TaxID=1815562 RepID=A0A437Q1D5_9GAMM|nr:LysR family transcriptional regulator [Neptunomonas marina]RVU28299.1 LysR family transcriptional regulator [Neptunomonas marina]